MSLVNITDKNTVPLIIINQNNFDTWLLNESEQVQSWIQQTTASNGISLIPDATGKLSKVVVKLANPEHFFASGDLVKLLPLGHYQLHAEEELQEAIAFGWAMGSYQFDLYKPKQELATLVVDDKALVEKVLKFSNASCLVRDLVNTPAADMMPEDLGQTALSLVEQYGGQVKQIIGDELLEQNYPTIHAVGRASVHKPRLIDLTWGEQGAPKVTLVGKGVCFDSGGLDLKPAAGMRNMKKDMGGSAHVLGLAQLIMSHKLPIQLRVLIPAVENAVSSNALRPGDVVTTRKGLTVEIDNTDAEGRLVLCDALDEANNDKPDLLIDIATLTGAMRVALGTELPGFFSNNDEIANELMSAGTSINDPVWRMPLYNDYKSLLDSNVADIANGAAGPFGGAITAALYLQEFVNPEINWLHFDVMAWNVRKLSGRPIGGEAFGIRTLFNYLQGQYGK
ncbi:leucyl aminopeptidase family protein [Thalassotalea psychrophila]|uniref:Leucyl aminopeptidase family protein n=1 Tax=Thalassotalea psychrophila TaxID=3065647 RepID=A0ABY9TPD4_9GAMM|nr:leucyl aminopeptidase family protein [Colwelliaceae bacterium SQ149]